ncbi:MAG TPA: glycerol-3-phosphate 1-O-acyltransferase PlsY [Candidatus Cloacimonas sp.]|nr:glycerol-3-phosphate 1-O-acyltransferase PlsY [Candidatus Cloacimonas sp.]
MPQINLSSWILLIFAYLLGSVPIGWIVGRIFFRMDIRKGGSGNIGATNALRMFGTVTGIIVLLLDMGKGLLAVLLAKTWLMPGSPFISLCALAVIFGHVFPLYLGFKGGKGVATAGGAFLALAPLSVLVAICVFVIIVALSRYVSLGSILGAMAFLGHALWQISRRGISDYALLALITIVVLMIVIKHRANLQRILGGTENKIAFTRQGKK